MAPITPPQVSMQQGQAIRGDQWNPQAPSTLLWCSLCSAFSLRQDCPPLLPASQSILMPALPGFGG